MFNDVSSVKRIPAVVKSNRRGTAQAARMRRCKVLAKFRLQNLKDHFKYLKANGIVLIKLLI